MDIIKRIQPYWYSGLLLFLLLGIFVRYCVYKKPFSQFYSVKNYCLKEKDTSFNGKIINAFIDYKNKGEFVFLFVNKTDTLKHKLFLIVLYPEAYIQTGDSIVKNKGESKFLIYKNCNPDSLVTLKFDCSYWDNK